MKKILVFGAAGTVGTYTCIDLKERGYDVIAVGLKKDDNGFFDLHDMKYYSVDICNKDDFNNFQWLAFLVLFILQGYFQPRYSICKRLLSDY